MSMFEIDSSPRRAARAPIPVSEIDTALTAQFLVAWAGETGEEKRLGWWRSDLVSQFGRSFGVLLRPQLNGVLQGAREAARRKDAGFVAGTTTPVFSRFLAWVSSWARMESASDLRCRAPQEALPGSWQHRTHLGRDRFLDWSPGHGEAESIATPIGRRLTGPADEARSVVLRLVSARPLADG